MNDVTKLSLSELAHLIGRRALSPVECVQAFLDRITRFDGSLHAYADVWVDEALALARASEQRVMAGLPLGLLEGIPLALKDLIHVQGKHTRAGSALFADRAPMDTTATLAARLLGAGAIPLGKTHLVELAYGGWGTNQGMGTPRNPWDAKTHRSPGGSSSGSVVAVAGGLAAAAIGTDTGGSVRIPAAFCGLTGLKTTRGRVSNHGLEMLSHTLDSVGPMTWTAEDAARILQVIHGPDPHDPATLAIEPRDFVSGLHESVKGVRFSVVDPADWGAVDAAVQQGVEAACNVLLALGCSRNDAACGRIDFGADQEESGIIISSEAYARHGEALAQCATPGDAAARARVMRGANLSSTQYVRALENRLRRGEAFRQVFDRTDVLVLPTVPVTAADVATLDEADLSPSRLTRFVGHYGLCAIALPCGHDREGLPVSVQLVAAPCREDLLLRLGVAYQGLTRHHLRRPAVA